jgi:hypothetical protein
MRISYDAEINAAYIRIVDDIEGGASVTPDSRSKPRGRF